MSSEIPDDVLGGLIKRALVPKGFRPRTSEELDQALDAIGDIEIDPQRVAEIVDRILCDEPIAIQVDQLGAGDDAAYCDSEVVGELVEMFRSEGDISPEIADRLRELESEANREANEDDDEASDGR